MAQWEEPNWADEWVKRRQRGQRKWRAGDVDEYEDPVTKRNFRYNVVTKESAWTEEWEK